MTSFSFDDTLSNPKFEGYKLQLIPQESAVARLPLLYKPTQATTSGKIPLSFQEMQSRITHNHIAVQNETSQAIYVDSEFKVILIDFCGDVPSFRVIYQLPIPVESSYVQPNHHEYPSAMFIGPTLVIASDGNGSLYVFTVKDGGVSEAIGIYSLVVAGARMPFKLHQLHRVSPTTAIAILSSKSNVEGHKPGEKHKPPTFDIWAIKVDLLSLRPANTLREMDVIWHRQGGDVPIFVSYLEQFQSHILIGGTPYQDPNIQIPTPYEPSSDEIAPIPRANENLEKSEETSKPPPYSWTQTNDSVTIAIPLPSNTPKNSIDVSFSSRTLTVHVGYHAAASIPIPQFPAKALWDGILPSSSLWTWDREGDYSCGLLTLHLEKQHEGTRWMQVFASAGSANSDDVEVPETLDPSELWHIRESLEKYTASLQEGKDASGLGLGTGVPSLADGEFDEEVDSSVGRQANITWVARDGSTPTWCKRFEEIPFQLLATPLPGLAGSAVSIVLKDTLDGTVFSLQADPSDKDQPTWVHTSTYSALAFVLASKRDTRFIYLVPSKAILAFESGGRNRGGNIYIYRDAPIKEKWAKQSVLKVDGGQGESLLGVGAVYGKNGDLQIVCLTDTELVLIKGI